MSRLTTTLLAFNRGLVSRLGLARVDVKRIASLSAETMTNFIPRVLGSMSIRPGWKYLGATRGNLAAKLIPFVYAVDDTAIIEVTTGNVRIWVSDALLTRGAVGTGLTNGTFATDLTGWTDSDEAGATSAWATGGYLQLLGDGTNSAIRDQEVTVSGGDSGDPHGLTVVIAKGPVTIRIGSAQGGEDYVRELDLDSGTHSFEFTPTGNFWIRFSSRLSRPVWVDSVAIESSGVVTITAPWSATDLDNLRWDQAGDIVFVACADTQPYMIKRWSSTSWAVVKYEPEDGPFLTENTSTITLTPSAITGAITLTASKSLFRSTHVGALFSITSEGQTVTRDISAQATFTSAIRITGVDSSRVFTIILANTWTGTVTLWRSLDSDDGPWEEITAVSWTANTTETFDDGLDNQIAWYRIGFDTGDWGSGTLSATLDYALGGITGVVRVTAYTSGTSVSADVLSDLGGTDATDIWAEGAWSDRKGWPTAVALHEGRLWFAGKSKVWGSVTDEYDSFDPDYEGDAGPISRSLGVGPVDRINWLFSSNRLLLGGDLNEYAARSSALDEPLTPTAFAVKPTSSQGSAAVVPGRIDSKAVFVNRTGIRVFENSMAQNAEYAAADLCQLVPEIGDPEIVRLAVQRQPDTRVHAIRSDGTVALAVIDRSEDVLGWCEIETDGDVEDACVLPASPGDQDDYVYYIVKRTIDGSTVRYLEKWSQTKNTRGGTGLGDPTNFQEFTGFDAVITDYTGTDGLYQYQQFFFYNPADQKFWVLGEQTDDLWVHSESNFLAPPVRYDGGDDVGYVWTEIGGPGCLSKEGGYIWLSSDSYSLPTSSSTLRCVDTSTGVVTDFGIVNSGARAKAIAATDSPFRVFTAEPGVGIRCYAPTLSTATLGAAVWTNAIGFNAGGDMAVWDDASTFWIMDTAVTPRLYQIVASSGVSAFHSVPTGSNGFRQFPAYNSNTQSFYVITTKTGVSTHKLVSYSGWSATPSNNSGTWTELFDYDPQTSLYGRWITYEAATDTLFMLYRSDAVGQITYAYRYTGEPKVLVDTVSISTISTDDIYPYVISGGLPVYKDGAAYIQAASSASNMHILKLKYDGADILLDASGNALTAAGVAGRLHNLADSYINYSGTPTTTVTGLTHLEGEEVVVWANGVDLGTQSDYTQTYTVASGQITLTDSATAITVGLPYTAQFKSAKLGLQGPNNEVLYGKSKRITELALVLADTHAKGVRFGPDFDNLDDRPGRDGWADVDADNIDTDYDDDMISFPTTWTADMRLCLQAQAPRPCTVLAVQLVMEV